MIDFNPIDHTPLDVEFCGSPSDYAKLMRMLKQVYAQLARNLRQLPRMSVLCSSPQNTFVVNQGPAFTSLDCEFAPARLPEPKLTKRVGREHD